MALDTILETVPAARQFTMASTSPFTPTNATKNTHKPSVGSAQLFMVDRNVPLNQKKITMQSIKKIVFNNAVASEAIK